MNSCSYYYRQQPPETPFCDPFGVFDLELKCIVCTSREERFSVQWYRDNETLKENTIVENSETVGNDSSGDVARCIESRLRIPGLFNVKHFGSYSCWIEQDVYGRQGLHPSRSIQLDGRADSQRCPSEVVFVEDLYLCAVITSPSTTVDPSSGTTKICVPKCIGFAFWIALEFLKF